MRRKSRLYLSGPITGVDNFREVFATARAILEQQGYPVVNPANMCDVLDTCASYEDFLTVDLLLIELSDVIVMLPGWEKSPGANRELGYAKGKGKTVMYMEDLMP